MYGCCASDDHAREVGLAAEHAQDAAGEEAPATQLHRWRPARAIGDVWCKRPLHFGDLLPSVMASSSLTSASLAPTPPRAGPQRCAALVLWFDTLFSDRFCKEHPVELSTSPYSPQTHWVQTVLLLKQPVEMVPPAAAAGAQPGAAVALAGQLSMTRSRQTHRSLDIVLRYAPQYAGGTAGEEQVCIYGMGVEA